MTNKNKSDRISIDDLTEAERLVLRKVGYEKLYDFGMKFGWGEIRLTYKDCRPVMIIEPQRDVKLD